MEFGLLAQGIGSAASVAAASSSAGVYQPPISKMLIVTLCVLGAVGMGFLLPANRGAMIRRLGGALLAGVGFAFMLLLVRNLEQLKIAGEIGVYFWAFSAIALVSAVRVITHPRPVYSALYFVLAVFATAGLFVLLQAEFMAAALVLIYAGAVLVTYVFVIMLAAESSGAMSQAAVTDVDKVSRDPMLAGAVGFALLGVLLLVAFEKAPKTDEAQLVPVTGSAVPAVAAVSASPAVGVVPASPANGGAFRNSPLVEGNTQGLGVELYERELVPVQVAMLLLTIAMTGAVIIARRKIVIPMGVAGRVRQNATDIVLSVDEFTADDPHSIPIYGTSDPRAKEYPET